MHYGKLRIFILPVWLEFSRVCCERFLWPCYYILLLDLPCKSVPKGKCKQYSKRPKAMIKFIHFYQSQNDIVAFPLIELPTLINGTL